MSAPRNSSDACRVMQSIGWRQLSNMANRIISLMRAKAVDRAVNKHARGGGLLDIRYGFSLLTSRNVPVMRKVLALGIGALLAAIVISLELPFESIVAGLLNLFGIGLDVVFDGFELIVGPVLFAALLMPKLHRPIPPPGPHIIE